MKGGCDFRRFRLKFRGASSTRLAGNGTRQQDERALAFWAFESYPFRYPAMQHRGTAMRRILVLPGLLLCLPLLAADKDGPKHELKPTAGADGFMLFRTGEKNPLLVQNCPR